MRKKSLLFFTVLALSALLALPAFAAPSLTNLTFSAGSLDKAFVPANTFYTLSVPADTTEVDVTATWDAGEAYWQVMTENGGQGPLFSGAPQTLADNSFVLPFELQIGLEDIGVGETTIYSVWIKEQSEAEDILPEKITLDRTELSIDVLDTATLTATILPEDTTDKRVIWSSDVSFIANVDANGKITARQPGTATITVRAVSSPDVKAACTVNVTGDPVGPLLKSLEFRHGNSDNPFLGGSTMTPTFQSNVFMYVLQMLLPGHSAFKVLPVAMNEGDVITVNGKVVESGELSERMDVPFTTDAAQGAQVLITVSDGAMANTYLAVVYNPIDRDDPAWARSDAFPCNNNIGVGTLFTFTLIGASIPFLGKRRKKK